MKNKIIQILIFVIFLSLIFSPNLITSELKNALDLFLTTLFPSIFPFFLISNLLIEYNFVHTLNKYLQNITQKIFHSSSSSSFIILMSMVSGFPSGSKYIRNLYDKNMLSLDQANYLITFTHFANPLFILTITNKMFTNSKIPIYIIISMYLSNIIIGIITRPKNLNNQKKLEPVNTPNFSIALSNSIKNSIDLLIIILGNTSFFFLVSRLITTYFNTNPLFSILINGFFDITKGIESINYINEPILFKCILILSFISFGGVNINMQVATILSETKIEYRNFLLGRISQTAISIIIFILLLNCSRININIWHN